MVTTAQVAGIVAPGLEIIACTALGFPLSWSRCSEPFERLVAPTLLRARAVDVLVRRRV